MARSLIVFPDDSVTPLLERIDGAVRSLLIKMFSLSDSRVINALIRAHRRGVKIRVMLNPARRSGEIQNTGSGSVLREAGVDVLDTNPSFDVTHEKSMVVDGTVALIGSLNWDPDNFARARDYAVVTADEKEVKEVIHCFEADWSRQPFEPWKSSNLVWSPGAGRTQIAEFIDSARQSLIIQNERYQDAIIVHHIVRAKLRGVKVHVMTRPSHSLRPEQLVDGIGDLRIMQDVGIKIRRLRHLKLHAKVLLVDRSRAVIGSINLTAGSFDKRRELAIRVDDPDILNRLWSVLHRDWKHSHPLDLTDEGVLKDLERHPERGGLSRAASVTASAMEPPDGRDRDPVVPRSRDAAGSPATGDDQSSKAVSNGGHRT